jgi:hypothetical protein
LIDAALSIKSPKLQKEGRFPPITALGTQDEKRIVFARQYAEKAGLPKDALEFQMLYGIRRDLQEELVRDGYPVSVWDTLVSIFHAQAGGTACQHLVLYFQFFPEVMAFAAGDGGELFYGKT